MFAAAVALLAVLAAAPPPAAPLPAPSAVPDSLIGVWEPARRSMGGIGAVLEFTRDGRFIKTMAILHDGYYRVEGDRLILREEEKGPEDPEGIRRFTIDGNALVLTPDGSGTRRERLGTPDPNASPIVGVWSYDYSGQSRKAYERYGPDSRFEFRLPMASDAGKYRVDGNAIVFAPVRGPENRLEFEIQGDRLLLHAKDRPPSEFHRIGETSWYDRDVSNVAARRSLEPKARLEAADGALSKASTAEARWFALPDAALLNAQFGPPERAAALASELLETAAHRSDDVNMALHKGNLAVGLVAIRAGRMDEAKARLLAAGNVSGDGTLDSFGPNMTLAKALLEKGERETVLQYLDLCRKFWKMDRGALDRWSAEIRAGTVPDFGANLLY